MVLRVFSFFYLSTIQPSLHSWETTSVARDIRHQQLKHIKILTSCASQHHDAAPSTVVMMAIYEPNYIVANNLTWHNAIEVSHVWWSKPPCNGFPLKAPYATFHPPLCPSQRGVAHSSFLRLDGNIPTSLKALSHAGFEATHTSFFLVSCNPTRIRLDVKEEVRAWTGQCLIRQLSGRQAPRVVLYFGHLSTFPGFKSQLV